MKQIDLNDKEAILARIAENEAELERRRPRKLDEFDLSSAEGILEEVLTAFDVAMEGNSQRILRGTTSRMSAAFDPAIAFFANRR